VHSVTRLINMQQCSLNGGVDTFMKRLINLITVKIIYHFTIKTFSFLIIRNVDKGGLLLDVPHF
jgi:hypothetical protein